MQTGMPAITIKIIIIIKERRQGSAKMHEPSEEAGDSGVNKTRPATKQAVPDRRHTLEAHPHRKGITYTDWI